jgi:tRNA(fMet)-specific endonuclease VapC
MKYLLDTDTCVFWLRGSKPLHKQIKRIGIATVAISAITLAELRYGASCSTRRDANHQAIDDFTGSIAILDVDSNISNIFGDLKAQLRQRGMLIEDFDLVIAATAQVYDLILVTNKKHFSRINWVAPIA